MNVKTEYRELHAECLDFAETLRGYGLIEIAEAWIDQVRFNHPDPEEIDESQEVIDLTGDSDSEIPMTPPRQITRQRSICPGAPQKPVAK